MPFVAGQNKYQMVYSSIDALVAPDSEARIIDAAVDKMNLREMGFTKAAPTREGRPSFPANTLLKLYIYGYLFRIRSSRDLAKACKVNIEVIWLIDCRRPDFRTICRFRKENCENLKKVFDAFTATVSARVGRGAISVDGTKILASNSKDNNFTYAKLDDRITHNECTLEEYVQQLDMYDAIDERNGRLSKEELEKKKAALEKRIEAQKGYRSQMEQSGQSQMSLTDEDSRLMKTGNGFSVAYNPQTAVDSVSHLILDFQHTNCPTDHGQLFPTVKAESERRDEIVHVIADKGYQKEEDMETCLENGIVPNVILPDKKDYYLLEFPYQPAEISEDKLSSTRPEDLRECLRAGLIPDAYKNFLTDAEVAEKTRPVDSAPSGDVCSPYGSEEEMRARAGEGFFVRDPERNAVYCPAGKTLRPKATKSPVMIRFANKTACNHCSHRNRCIAGKNKWKEIDFNKDTLEKPCRLWLGQAAGTGTAQTAGRRRRSREKYWAVTVKFYPDKELMSKRFSTSEHPNGTIKRALGCGYYLLRGMKKTAGETALFCLCYNIRRARNLLGFDGLMRALKEKEATA